MAVTLSDYNRYAFWRFWLSVALAAGGFVIWVRGAEMLMNPDRNQKLHTLRSMHMVHGDYATGTPDVPKSYFDLDWIMHPQLERASEVYRGMPSALQQGKTDGTELIDTGVEGWQRASACPYPGENHDTWKARVALTDDQETVFVCGKDEKHCPVVKNSQIRYPNMVMLDVCRLQRMPEVFVFSNDANSWSIASLQSTMVLLFFVGIVLFLLGTYEALRWYVIQQRISNKDFTKGMRAVWIQIAISFVMLGVILLVRFSYLMLQKDSVLADGTTDSNSTTAVCQTAPFCMASSVLSSLLCTVSGSSRRSTWLRTITR